MENDYCTDCKKKTKVVFDHSAGDTICSEYGLVLESRSIDNYAEWRTFADSSVGHDPTRVGSPVHPLLSNGGLSTVVSKAASGGGGVSVLNRFPCRGPSDPDRPLIAAFQNISYMSDSVFLHQVEPRDNYKEICTIANGVTKNEIGRAKDLIVRQLKVEMDPSMEMGTIHAEDYLRRFCSNLGMGHKEIKAVQEAVQNSKGFDIRSPVSIAAAIIYMITQLSDMKKPLKDISISTTVAETTIKNAYKDLYPHASRIVPNWFSKENNLNKLLRA